MKTILVVDDEYALRELVGELLELAGYRVVTAANGSDALERALGDKPDLVVTDHMMPIADGRELVRNLRALPEYRSLPIIMLSAAAKSVALADALAVTAFVRKPFVWEKLSATVEALIGPGDKASPP
jgi:two-component system, chemotaxis family, chemotaxis protein CheY